MRTKATLTVENARLAHENTILNQALNAIVNNRVQKIHHYSESGPDGAKYVWTIADLTRGHGGLLIQTFRIKGQSDSISVRYLDDAVIERSLHTEILREEYQAVSIALDLRNEQLAA